MPKILNFGSMNFDFVYEVEHFVRPQETISSLSLKRFFGGKGLNQSVALARAGAKVCHAGVIGVDGKDILEMFCKNGVDAALIKSCDMPTGHAIIQKDGNGQNCIILCGGANHNITDDYIDETLSQFSCGDYVLLQNEINNVGAVIKKAKAKGMAVVLNPSPMDAKILDLPLELVDIFLLNETEAADLVGEADEKKSVKMLGDKYPKAEIVLTLGERGAIYSDQEKRILRQGAYSAKVVDTTAAGDTFSGYFIACKLSGKSVEESLKTASAASAIAVSRLGAQPSIPHMEEVVKFVAM